ncbi:MAG: glycosyltransferase 87 family protein [Acidimicrobiales bacterium]
MSEARWALRAAVLPWLVARVVVLAALAVARQIVSQGHVSGAMASRVHAGLLGWDAGWYEAIARTGYGGAGHQALRFFPLVPLLGRMVAVVPGITAGAGVVVVANISALAGTAVLVALARWEKGDDALARRAAWLVCLAPPAFTFVMGYAEATLLALAAGTMFALRRRRWWWAAGLGAAAALARPIGVLLVVAAVVEAGRRLGGTRWPERVSRGAAVAGPAAGCGAFLGFVWWRYGDPLAPIRIQEEGGLRGHLSDPLRTLGHDARLLVHGQHLGTAIHLPWVILAVVLLVVVVRRWPAGYGALAAAAMAVTLTASNLDGFERYALSTFPLVLAAASLTASTRVERSVLALAAAGLGLGALLAFTNLAVP